MAAIQIDNYPLLTDFLARNNMTVSVQDNTVDVVNTLTTLSPEEYPIALDVSFEEYNVASIPHFGIVLYAQDGQAIGTYGARMHRVESFHEDCQLLAAPTVLEQGFVDKYQGTEQSWYSSLQWIHSGFRGRNLGTILDHLKKNIIFDYYNGAINFCLHEVGQTDYHTTTLGYNESFHLGEMTTNRSVDRSISVITAEQWRYKRSQYDFLYS
jgi:hypothetical protein